MDDLRELAEPPSGDFPRAPVETTEQALPFDGLAWENFEKLCMRMARREGHPRDYRRYGVRGQAQAGIDFYGVLPSGKYATYQCKRYETIAPSDIADAVTKFLEGDWAEQSERFVFCTSREAVRTELAHAVEDQRKRLAAERPPIAFEIWDADELSMTLKENPGRIVRDFFGPHWEAAFLGASSSGETTPTDIGALVAEAVSSTLGAQSQRPRFITNDWAPELLRRRLDEVRAMHGEDFLRLNDQIGNPPKAPLLQAAVATPPEWLQAADPEIWDLLARVAQDEGEWRSASQAWEQKADRIEGSARAGALTSAALAAHLDGDDDRYHALIRAAGEVDDRNPRLVLELMSEDADPAEQLKLLAELGSDDPEEQALIAARATIAHLLTPNLDQARSSLEEVRRHLPDSMLVQGLEVSLTVQEGRLAFDGGRGLSRPALRAAVEKARLVRERMIASKRWSEATRLLMLEADAEALLWDRRAATKVLRRALPEEMQTLEQKVVLALCAAGRALDFQLALDLLEGVEETSTVRLIRLEAQEQLGSPPEREAALAGLEELMREGGRDAAEAALARLAATLGDRETPWSDEAATYLKDRGFEKAAISAEAYYLQRHEGFDAATKVLEPYADRIWARATAVRLALSPSAPRDAAVSAAERLLELGPSHLLRVEAGRAYARGRELGRAREALIAVARDPEAPEAVRGDAYALLMDVAGNDQGDWGFAAELYTEWYQCAPKDERIPPWAPRIANRRRAA